MTRSEAIAEVRALAMAATHNHGNVDVLFGPGHAMTRAAIMSVIAGKKVAKSNAGYTKFMDAILALSGITMAECTCLNDRDRRLQFWIRNEPMKSRVRELWERAARVHGEKYADEIWPDGRELQEAR